MAHSRVQGATAKTETAVDGGKKGKNEKSRSFNPAGEPIARIISPEAIRERPLLFINDGRFSFLVSKRRKKTPATCRRYVSAISTQKTENNNNNDYDKQIVKSRGDATLWRVVEKSRKL